MRVSSEHPGRLPDLVIIGAPKCATTSVARWLGQAGDAFVPEAKELRFLDRKWERGVAWYRERLRGARDDQVIVEATPEYLAHPDAPHRAAELGLERFVVILRDPTERAWSHYWFRRMFRPDRSDFARPFEEVVAGELAAGCPDGGILTHGRYARHIERWVQANGRDTVLGVNFRQVADAPSEAFHRIREFAGLPRGAPPAELGMSHNTGYRLRWPALRAFMFRRDLFRRIPGDLALRLDRLNRGSVPSPRISADTRAVLDEFHAPDLEVMRELFERVPVRRDSR